MGSNNTNKQTIATIATIAWCRSSIKLSILVTDNKYQTVSQDCKCTFPRATVKCLFTFRLFTFRADLLSISYWILEFSIAYRDLAVICTRGRVYIVHRPARRGRGSYLPIAIYLSRQGEGKIAARGISTRETKSSRLSLS